MRTREAAAAQGVAVAVLVQLDGQAEEGSDYDGGKGTTEPAEGGGKTEEEAALQPVDPELVMEIEGREEGKESGGRRQLGVLQTWQGGWMVAGIW